MSYDNCGGEKTCPGCGKTFGCDYERAAKCWCQVEFPSAARPAALAGQCYCLACLRKLAAAPAGTPPA